MTISRGSIALMVASFFALNPYMIGLSVFVYTDMIALLFLVTACIAVLHHKPVLLCLSSAGMLLSRQHYIFLVGAAFVYYIVAYLITRERRNLFMISSCLLSFIPLAMLIFLWKGFSPVSEISTVYMGEPLYFHGNYVIFYITQFFVYLFPFMIFNWNILYKDYRLLIGSFVLSWVYWLVPVAPSKYTLMSEVTTTGFFHRSIRSIFENTFLEHCIYHALFFLGLPFVVYLFRDSITRVRKAQIDFLFFLNLTLFSFLLVMPLAYMAWEKYFLSLIPLCAIRLICAQLPCENCTTSTPA
jgi:hypothetical protein